MTQICAPINMLINRGRDGEKDCNDAYINAVLLQVHTCIRADVHMCTRTQVHVHKSTHAHPRTCTFAYIHLHAYMHTCFMNRAYVYKHTFKSQYNYSMTLICVLTGVVAERLSG